MNNSAVVEKPEKITIFGMAGTGKSTTAKILADKLGYVYMSGGNLYRQMAQDHNMSLNEFEILTNNNDQYDIELDTKTKEYGKNNDKYVLESRLGWYSVPDSFKVALVCDFDTRTNRIAERENKDIAVAQNETNHREEIINEKYKKLYGLEHISNPENFNLVIDTKENDIESVVNSILEAYTIWRSSF
jgi:predicted cytidylate kinase